MKKQLQEWWREQRRLGALPGIIGGVLLSPFMIVVIPLILAPPPA